MQERFLTPRMLHFTDSQVYWECATVGVANERCAEGISEPEPLDMTSFVYPAFTLDLDEADHYRLWGELVHDYSSLALTQPAQDKLVAIGAIAARLAEKSEDEYVAGVFRRDLLRSLCWLPWLKTAEAVERLTNSNTPSWSWASMHCPLRFGHVHINDETMAKLVDVSIKLRDRNNSFGAVNSGKLLLRGRLLQAQLTARLPSDERQRPKFVVDIGGAIETGLLRDAFRDLEELYGFTGSHYFLPLFWGLSLARRKLSIQDSLALRAKDGNFNLEDHVVRGLLLQKQPDQSFKRIHMLFSVSSEILQAWAATTEELITLV